jgi:hypothetical protein
MYNLNDSEKKKNTRIITAVTTKAANAGRRRLVGGPRKK